jgi:predicted DNA binding CopG/RHH family protein
LRFLSSNSISSVSAERGLQLVNEQDLDNKITEKEAELTKLRDQMEHYRLQFIKDTGLFAKSWFEETAKNYVVRHPEITMSMSEEKLAQMKNMVNELIENAQKIVNDALSRQGIWWNLKPKKNESFSSYEQLGDESVGNKFPASVDRPVRRALGKLGVVLEKFGYKVTVNESNVWAYPEFWFETIEEEGSVVPCFPHLLVWSEAMQSTLQQYDALFRSAIVLFNEIEKLKGEKKKQEISQRWDST